MWKFFKWCQCLFGAVSPSLTFNFGSGYIYMTLTFFKSRVSSFFNIFRVAKKFINFDINPSTHQAQTLTLKQFLFRFVIMQSRKYSLSYVAVAIFT